MEVGDLLNDDSIVKENDLEGEELAEMRSKMAQVTGEADQVKNADAVLRAYCSVDQMSIVAPGVEIHNVTGASVGRKLHPSPVTVESHQFVAHFEVEGDVLGSEEERSCESSSKAVDLAQYEALCQWEFDQLERHFKLQGETKVLEEPEKSLKERFMGAKDGNAFLKVLSTAVADLTDENNNNSEGEVPIFITSEVDRRMKLTLHLKEVGLKLVSSAEIPSSPEELATFEISLFNYLYSNDLTTSIGQEERLIRPLVDLVAENFSSNKEFSVLQLSPTSQLLSLATKVDRYLATSTIFRLSIDYNIVHSGGSSTEPSSELPYNFTSTAVSSFEQFPTSEVLGLKAPPQLAVIVDQPLMQKTSLPLEEGQFWSALASTATLLPSGFALVFLRSSLSPIERTIYETLFGEKIPSDEALRARIAAVQEQAAKYYFFAVGSKASHGQVALLLRYKPDLINVTPPVFSTVAYESDEERWLEAVQEKQKMVTEEVATEETADQAKQEKIVWLLADVSTLPGALGFFNCLRKEPGGRQFRLLFNLDEGVTALDIFNRYSVALTKLDLAVNVYQSGGNQSGGGVFGSYRHLTRNLLFATKLTADYHLNIGALNANRNDLGSLSLVDSTGLRQIGYLPERGGLSMNSPKERLYAVYSSALNFRDVMVSVLIISFKLYF